MGRRNVTSREHKLLLKARRFAGDEKEMLKAVRDFWRDLAPVLKNLNIRKEGKLDNIAKKQIIRVYDTKALRLRNNSTILRSRVNLDNDKNELTLKFRHPDRYISQERDATAGLPDQETKFEEDIAVSPLPKPSFFTNYTFSATENVPFAQVPDQLKKLAHLFPGLPDSLDKYREDEALSLVADFAALELVMQGATLHLSTAPTMLAQCALIVWYRYKDAYDPDRNNQPVLAEFSFRYGDEEEEYPLEATLHALALFERLKSFDWARSKSSDKTDYLYDLAKAKGK